MNIEVLEKFQENLLGRLEDKVRELNVYDKENYTQEEFKKCSLLITSFTILLNAHRQYLDAIGAVEIALED
jgi:hypothetical protein